MNPHVIKRKHNTLHYMFTSSIVRFNKETFTNQLLSVPSRSVGNSKKVAEAAIKAASPELSQKVSTPQSLKSPVKKNEIVSIANDSVHNASNNTKIETLANKKLTFVQDQLSSDIKAQIFSDNEDTVLLKKTEQIVTNIFDNTNYPLPSQVFKNDLSTTFLNAANPSDQVDGTHYHERTHANILVKQGDNIYVTHILTSSKKDYFFQLGEPNYSGNLEKDQLLATLETPRLIDKAALPEYKYNEEATTFIESKPHVKQLAEMSGQQSIKAVAPTMRKLSTDSSFYNEAGQKSNIETTHTDYKDFFDADVD